ncbi:hypothetical protein GALMADRAFT_623486 [Galerina marginata CBS 339.88]|uniref:GPI-GlcNAc transferase complex PIG-H component conserved domain-containing protein n=1 Tax=Galerina marginata (strain CBS 339.88) TaxID=685588 RepID=A0A067SU79_GALM3|nr:hypothetical protein GALMADRAFT_623486 [Galerina marginata CBS 339.88]
MWTIPFLVFCLAFPLNLSPTSPPPPSFSSFLAVYTFFELQLPFVHLPYHYTTFYGFLCNIIIISACLHRSASSWISAQLAVALSVSQKYSKSGYLKRTARMLFVKEQVIATEDMFFTAVSLEYRGG